MARFGRMRQPTRRGQLREGCVSSSDYQTSRAASSACVPGLAVRIRPKLSEESALVTCGLVNGASRFLALNTLNTCAMTSILVRPWSGNILLPRTSTLLNREESICDAEIGCN